MALPVRLGRPINQGILGKEGDEHSLTPMQLLRRQETGPVVKRTALTFEVTAGIFSKYPELLDRVRVTLNGIAYYAVILSVRDLGVLMEYSGISYSERTVGLSPPIPSDDIGHGRLYADGIHAFTSCNHRLLQIDVAADLDIKNMKRHADLSML